MEDFNIVGIGESRIESVARVSAAFTVKALVMGASKCTPGPYVGIGFCTIRLLSVINKNYPRIDFTEETLFNDSIDAIHNAF